MRAAAVMWVAVLGLAPAARADVRTVADAHVTVDVPATWKMDAADDDTVFSDAKAEVAVHVVALAGATDVRAAAAALAATLGRWAQNVKLAGDRKALKLNGMDATFVDAIGDLAGKKAELWAVVVRTPAGGAVVVASVAPADKVEAHRSELRGALNSVRPLR